VEKLSEHFEAEFNASRIFFKYICIHGQVTVNRIALEVATMPLVYCYDKLIALWYSSTRL